MSIWAFDLDEVLCDFSSCLIEVTNQYFGLSLSIDDFAGYYLQNVLGLKEEIVQPVLDITTKTENLLILPAILDGLTLFQKIKKNNIVHIITARNESMRSATQGWLDRHGIIANSLIMTNLVTKDKEAKKLNIQYAVEDHPDHANGMAEIGVKVFMPIYPWNRNKKLHHNIQPVNNCSEILELINDDGTLKQRTS